MQVHLEILLIHGAPQPGELNSTSSFEFGCWIHVWVWIASKKLASQPPSEPTNSLSHWWHWKEFDLHDHWPILTHQIHHQLMKKKFVGNVPGPLKWTGHPWRNYVWGKITINGWQWIESIFVRLILPSDLAKGKGNEWDDVSTESLVFFTRASQVQLLTWRILG